MFEVTPFPKLQLSGERTGRLLRTLTVQACRKKAQLETMLVLDMPVQLCSQSTQVRVAQRQVPVPVPATELEAESHTQKELPTFIGLVRL